MSDEQERPEGHQDSGATHPMPAVAGAGEPSWSGRAEVRPPRPGDGDAPDGWGADGDSDARPWWLPILFGTLALVLLALVGWGVWFIVTSVGAKPPVPVGVTTAPTVAPATPSSAPVTRTSSVATTRPTAPATTAPAAVTIPALRGLTVDEARQALSRRGLSSRLRFVVSADAPAGVVIDSDPPEGAEVPQDTVVTLVVATPATVPSGAVGPSAALDEN